nr:MAG TPA: hypothetical protein [Bacteriophage sp.]
MVVIDTNAMSLLDTVCKHPTGSCIRWFHPITNLAEVLVV